MPARVDEGAIQDVLTGDDSDSIPPTSPSAGRGQGARRQRAQPGALVIGADQVLVLEARSVRQAGGSSARRASSCWICAARRTSLHSCGCRRGRWRDRLVAWSTRAELTMRAFSDAFLDALSGARPATHRARSVGAYQLEGLGLQLFERIEGDYFTILGLPLLPLLAELRARGALGQ